MASQDITMLAGLTDESASYFSTITGEDMESRKTVFNAVQSAEPIANYVGKTIAIANIIVQRVEVTSENGEVDVTPRVIFLDDKGKAYAGLSTGLLRSAENILHFLGDPSTWEEPVKVVVSEKRGRRGFRFYTLDLA